MFLGPNKTFNWIKEELIKNNFDKKLVNTKEFYEKFIEDTKLTSSYRTYTKNVSRVGMTLEKEMLLKQNHLNEIDEDVLTENVRLAKKLQREVDLNRIRNKGFREFSRIENALEEYNKQLIELLKNNDLNKITIKHESLSAKAGGVIQLSDLHFNELICISGNKYDFSVAAKRLKKFAIQIKQYFIPLKIKEVLLSFTGDILNSNRRLDELLNQATNRSDATMLAFFLLKQFILDLNQEFNISIASVSGNESRIDQEMGYSDILARENFDFTIENFLKVQFMNCPGIKFFEGDAKEKVVNIAGQNILLLHGEGLGKETTKAIQQKVGGYAFKNININYVIYGHMHAAHISDHFSRSSSMAGSNDYNEKQLGLVGRASQNIYIFYNDGNRDVVKIDLQHADSIEGYEIIKELEAYHAKSHNKTHEHKTILEIVI